MHIYTVKTRENRTEITNSYFGLIYANYEHVANYLQHAHNEYFTILVLKKEPFRR